MDEPKTDTPSATPTLNPVTRVVAEGSEPDDGEGPGINRQAAKQMSGLSDAFVALSVAFSALRRDGRQILTACVSWLRADTRNATIAAMSLALLVVSITAVAIYRDKAPIAAQITTAATPKLSSGFYTVVSGDSWDSAAKKLGVTTDALQAANPRVIDDNTAWCLARVVDGEPISNEYLAGYLADGKTLRRTSFCQMFGPNGEKLTIANARNGRALKTLKLNQRLAKPTADTNAPALVDAIGNNGN